MDYAARALGVTEAQYQDAVRIEINNLYIGVRRRAGGEADRALCPGERAGLERLLQETQALYEKDMASRADVNEVKSQRQIAEVGVLDAEENLRRAKRTLAMMLNLPPDRPIARGARHARGSRRQLRRRWTS